MSKLTLGNGAGRWGGRMGFLVLLLWCLEAGAGNYTRWVTNYYTVTGSTLREIQKSIRRNRPAHVDREAVTQWNVRSRFSAAKWQGEYRCGGFTTTTTIRITLPRWTPPEGVDAAVREAWQRYITALEAHELGHAQFALSMAAELHRRVRAMGTDPDPRGLTTRVEALIRQTTEEFKQREREFDRLTNHGLEQGARLAAVYESAEERRPLDQPTR